MDPVAAQNPQQSVYAPTSQDLAGSGSAAPSTPIEHPLRPIVTQWLEKIKLANQFKQQQFGKTAEEGMRYFNGPYDFMYKKEYASADPWFGIDAGEDDSYPAPAFRMTCNKVAEMVQIFGPVLYHRNPDRVVRPREVPAPPTGVLAMQSPDPMEAMMAQQMEVQLAQIQQQQLGHDQARAELLQWYLNYTPNELGLKEHMRLAIDETMIKGASCLWTEMYAAKGTQVKLVGTFWDTVDNLVIDPDMESFEEAHWIAKKCVHPCWEVERDYGLLPGTVKGNMDSFQQQAYNAATGTRSTGDTNDLCCYWKVYSKMGIGGRLKGAPAELKDVLEQFGDFCYLVVADGVPYPLNLPPAVMNTAPGPEMLQRLDWPTPFWADDKWPCTLMSFHPVPRQVWPMSHLAPALGELKFLNWCYSFIASKIRNTARDFLACQKSLGEEIVNEILHGRDLTLLRIDASHGTISDVVQFLQHPSVNGDFWKVLEVVQDLFDKRTGLTELIYGYSGSAMRSAQEAALKGDQLQIRPDDMNERVETAATAIARLEAICIRWHLAGEDVAPIMGKTIAPYWDNLVHSADLYAVTRQLEYRIEAGSTKKPNRDRDAANLNQAMQTLFMPLYQYAQATGDTNPVNALIGDWAKSIGMDASRYLLMAPPPPPPAPAPAGEGGKKEEGAPPPEQAPPPEASGMPPEMAGMPPEMMMALGGGMPPMM